MRQALAVVLSVAAFGPFAVRGSAEPVAMGDPRAAAAGVNAFTADLLRATAASGGNAFLSPYSISVAMAMARAGARGETASQIDAALHLPLDGPAAYRALVATLADAVRANDRPAYALSVANGLFSQKGWSFEPAFRATIARDYGAELQELDFGRTEAARKAINDWVAAKTKVRLRDIVPPGLPAPDTRLALANAIHFKAAWETAFNAGATTDRPFTVAAGRDVTVKSMSTTREMRYGETVDAQVLEIPYVEHASSMVVVLPKARDGLDALIAALTSQRLEAYAGRLEQRPVSLQLPKFTFTASIDAKRALQALGVKTAFSDRADFGGISSKDPVLIDAVLHKAFVAVDEEGTEAAAATVGLMAPTSAVGRPQEPTPFVVDHPFLFLIRHGRTGAILFAGRVVDPTER
jgi:serpin B